MDNVGFQSLAIVYVVFSFANFLATPIVEICGSLFLFYKLLRLLANFFFFFFSKKKKKETIAKMIYSKHCVHTL